MMRSSARRSAGSGLRWSDPAGKDADLLIWTGDPFEPLSQPGVDLIA